MQGSLRTASELGSNQTRRNAARVGRKDGEGKVFLSPCHMAAAMCGMQRS